MFGDKLVQEIPHLRRFARSLTRDKDEADDLLQATLERALAKKHMLRKPGSLRSWLFRIMYNAHINTRQKASAREVPMDFLEDSPLVVSVIANQEQQMEVNDILAALYQLPIEQRAAISLTAIEGLSYREASKVLKIPQGTLMSRLFRGRQALRRTTGEDTVALRTGPTLFRVK
ncbi:sigma-70 family RNA polymerase sigma factor [Epibacterium ulvae]|uniref:sigma-70 family RNA polymerase sigma factor n=1 Tax=Epibacterium ulvae TaxID=1156985 RepID=UPI002493906A|nr:sigma-70 family RNA polymerase sigma factor [Epibacterium ulvae]